MQQKARMISGAQLVMLLFCSRLFTLLTFAPRAQVVSGSTALLSLPVAAVGVGIALLPGLLLVRKAGSDPLSCAFAVGHGYGAAVSLLLVLFCLYMAAYTASHFAYFMASTVYTNTRSWIFVLTLLPVAAYAAYLGLEAFSRFGVAVFALTVGAAALIICTLLPQANLYYLASPLREGKRALGGAAFYAACSNAEAVLFLLLFPRAKGRSGRTLCWWLFWAALAYELLTFLTLTVLGDFARTKTFPLYSAAALAQFASFGRLDLLHITVWVFTAFLRTALYLYCAAVCLRRVFPRLGQGVGAAFCAAVSGAFSLVTTGNMWFWSQAGGVMAAAAPFLTLVVGFPLFTMLLLALQKRFRKRGKG